MISTYNPGSLTRHHCLIIGFILKKAVFSAVKIILDRAVASLPFIINACKEGQPIETRTKAISALQLLTRKGRQKKLLSTNNHLY